MEREQEIVKLTCPICGHIHMAPIVPVVDTEQDQETWQSFRKGGLFRFDCPGCGYPLELSYSFLCQDSAIRQYIYLSREEPSESCGFQGIVRRAEKLAKGEYLRRSPPNSLYCG